MARPIKQKALDATDYLGVRVHPSVREALDRIARMNGRVLAEEIRAAFDEHIERAERRARKAGAA